MSKRDRRVAARTKAAGPAGDQDQPGPAGTAGPVPAPPDEDAPLAKVIPMKIFDPFAEADKRW
jgi:putative transposase